MFVEWFFIPKVSQRRVSSPPFSFLLVVCVVSVTVHTTPESAMEFAKTAISSSFSSSSYSYS